MTIDDDDAIVVEDGDDLPLEEAGDPEDLGFEIIIEENVVPAGSGTELGFKVPPPAVAASPVTAGAGAASPVTAGADAASPVTAGAGATSPVTAGADATSPVTAGAGAASALTPGPPSPPEPAPAPATPSGAASEDAAPVIPPPTWPVVDWSPEPEPAFAQSALGAVLSMLKITLMLGGFGAMLLLLWLVLNKSPLLGLPSPGHQQATDTASDQGRSEPILAPRPFEIDSSPPSPQPSPSLESAPTPEARPEAAPIAAPAPMQEPPPASEPTPAVALATPPTRTGVTGLLAGGPSVAAATLPAAGRATALSPNATDGEATTSPPPRILTAAFETEPVEPGILEKIAELKAEASSLDAAGKPAEALERWLGVLDLAPEDTTALFEAALLEHIAGRLNQALDLYQQDLALDPWNVRALNNIGLIFQARGESKRARKAFREALARQPEFAEALTNMGNLELEATQPRLARDQYLRALDIDPAQDPARLNLGRALIQLGDPDRARQLFQELADTPGSALQADAHEALGRLHAGAGDHQEAVRAYRRAIALREDFLTARNNLASSLLALGQPQQALDELIRSRDGDPDDALTWTNLGHALVALNRLQDAKDAYEEALEIDDSLIETKYNYALCAERFGNYPYAMVEYERVLELDPTHARAWNNLGLIYRRAGLIETTPERTDEYLLRSLEFFSRSVKEDPQLLEPRVNRCATLVDLRRLEEAQTSLLELVQLSQASEPSPQTTQAIDVLQRKLAALAPRASEPQAPLPVQPDRQTSRAEGPH